MTVGFVNFCKNYEITFILIFIYGKGEGNDEIYPHLFSFDISDNGDRIIFQYYGDNRVVSINSDGSGANVIFKSTDKQRAHVAISGDGSKVVYHDWGSPVDDPDGIIYLNSFDGSSESDILSGGNLDYYRPGDFILNNVKVIICQALSWLQNIHTIRKKQNIAKRKIVL